MIFLERTAVEERNVFACINQLPELRRRQELQDEGFVVVTKRGKKLRGHPTLVAVTWDGIDDCGVDYEEGVKVSAVPLGYWRFSSDERQSLPELRVVGN